MRYKILLLVLIFVACVGAALFDYTHRYSDAKDPDEVTLAGQTVPNFTFKNSEDGKVYHITDFKNKTVLVNFWASWCPPCRRESHKLTAIAKKHPHDLVLVMLSEDDTEGKALDFARSLPITANVYIAWDGRIHTAQNIFQTYRYPETIIIQPGGKIQRKIIGEISDQDVAEIHAALH